MIFMLLGPVGYAQLTSPEGFDLRTRTALAEHARIDGKPTLQVVGQDLDRITLDLAFHKRFKDPQTAWNELTELRDSGEAFPLSMGTGQWVGDYVISALSRETVQTSQNGALEAIGCRVELIEFIERDPLAAREAQQRKTAEAVAAENDRCPNSTMVTVPAYPADQISADFGSVSLNMIVRMP